MKLSVVVPVFNEADNLVPLHSSLVKVLSSLKGVLSYEVVFVDDGSSDGSSSVLERLHSSDKCVRVVELRRNYGQTAAISAGFSASSGDVVVVMDSDLQNDPADIPLLLGEMGKGFDVVSGWRARRHDSLIFKKIPSLFSNWLARRLTGLSLHDFGCSLKAYRRSALEDVRLYGEMHRYIPAILHMRGYRIGEVKVSHHARLHGRSKYGVKRLLRGMLDLFFIKFWSGYSTRPLHFFGLLGFLSAFLGGVIGVANISYYLFVVGRFSGIGPLLLLSALLFILGFQLVFFGFLAEIIIRGYYGSGNESPYYVKRVLK